MSREIDQITLDFSQDFLDLGGLGNAFAIQVGGPDGKFYTVGCVTVEPSRLSIAAQLGESGTYTVVWQIVSSDGHPTSDTYEFTFERPSDTDSAVGSPTADTCTPPETTAPAPTSSLNVAAPPSQPGADPYVAPVANSVSPGLPLPLIVGGVVLVAVAAAVAHFIIRRRRAVARGRARPSNSPE